MDSLSPMSAVADRQRELHRLLLHIAVSSPSDADELSARVARPRQAVQEDLSTLIKEGRVHLHDGALRTPSASRLLEEATGAELREIHYRVLAQPTTGPAIRPATLVALAESGCTEDVLFDQLIRASGEHPENASVASALVLLSRARGEGDDALRLRRASDAAARCRPNEVLALTETVISSLPIGEATSLQIRAALLSSMAHMQCNRLDRAAAMFTHVGEDRIGVDAAWAVIAAVGQGDLIGARQWRSLLTEDRLTNRAAGLTDFADGVLASVEGSGERALELLADSTSALAPLGDDVILPETPAAVGALVSLGQGEPATAEILLERALRLGLGGEPGKRRHLLLLAWCLMMRGCLSAAERTIADLDGPSGLCDRDVLLYWCLCGGIARRRTDLSGMLDAWNEIRGHSFGMHITVYDLLPLGEMIVLAARLRESSRVTQMLQAAVELLSEMGVPALWATPLNWHGVQAAFEAEDPAALIPYANALTQAGRESSYASMLAMAGNTWLEVLRGEFDSRSVETSARALSLSGHTWEASKLAGQAALQHPERESALSMMQLARELSKDQLGYVTLSSASQSVLTSRELEVAALVVDGMGYRAIGKQLFISPKTVEHHVARMRARIGATSRPDLLEKLREILSKSRR